MNKILIPKEQLPLGVKFCIDNVNRLLQSAKILHNNAQYPNSIVLSIIAYEEIGKAIKLCDKWIAKEDIYEQEWNELRFHVTKSESVYRFVYDNMLNFNNDMDAKFKENMSKIQAESTSKKDKESYMYVDWINNNWSSPILPRMIPPDTDPISWMKLISDWKMQEVKIALGYFLRDEKSKLIQQAPTPNIITDSDVREFLRQRLGRTKDQMGITIQTYLGKVKRISINWINPILTDEQQSQIKSEIKRMFPKLKEFMIRNKPDPKT